MKRNRMLPAVLLVFPLILSSCASGGRGGSSSAAAQPSPEEVPAPDYYDYQTESTDRNKLSLNEIRVLAGYGETGSSRVYADADSKLIREASVGIQSTDFPAAVVALDKLTADMGGYYESAQIQGGDYYDSNARRYANYTVRVPKENYDAFLNAAGDIGHVVSSSETSTDVGDQYYDTELRLKTLQIKQDRLMALLEKAELMEDIIALENALSDVQYQIEQHTSTLKRYDGLVDFATIKLTIQEVIKLSNEPGEAASLGERFSDAFVRGFSDFGTALGNLSVWIAYHFIGVVLFGAAIAAGAVAGRRAVLRRRKKQDSSGQ